MSEGGYFAFMGTGSRSGTVVIGGVWLVRYDIDSPVLYGTMGTVYNTTFDYLVSLIGVYEIAKLIAYVVGHDKPMSHWKSTP